MNARAPRDKRWIVRPGDGADVSAILEKAGETAAAVEEGRVFVGRRRVLRASDPVKAGDEVRIGARMTSAALGFEVLWQKDGLVACVKPAGVPTVPDHAGASHSLVALASGASGTRVQDMRVTSRLDRDVSGVVVFATTAEAEDRLKRARETGRYTRRYLAIATDAFEPSCEGRVGVWNAPIGRGRDARHRAADGPEAKPSTTHWAIAARTGGFALLAVEPQTGRTHQIRVHASHAHAPLLGDRAYGGAVRVSLAGGKTLALARVALHAARITVPASDGSPLVAEAPIPGELRALWTALGGGPEAWNRALSCLLVV